MRTKQALALLAEAQGISKQEATERAIPEAAARRVHEGRVRGLSAAARARYADVLERRGPIEKAAYLRAPFPPCDKVETPSNETHHRR